MLYMFTRVFCNFYFIHEGYFVISSFISLNLFTLLKMTSCKSLLIHSLELGQPNSLHHLKFILLTNKSSQISSIKHAIRNLILKYFFRN